jgi:hypothetical protein
MLVEKRSFQQLAGAGSPARLLLCLCVLSAIMTGPLWTRK